MDIDFWHERWSRGETGFHQPHVNPWLGYYYGEAGPPMHQRAALRVFVPLCGKSRDVWWLAQSGYETVGVECSEVAVEAFFREHQLAFEKKPAGPHVQYSGEAVSLLLGDYFELTRDSLGCVTDVFDRAALIALPPDMRVRYVQKLTELLSPGARILLITLTYPQHEMNGPPFSVDEAEIRRLYGARYEIDTLAAKNTLEDEPRFRERGLTALTETAWKMTLK